MPPRDLYDVNPIYEQVFFQSYCEFLAGYPELEIYPTYLMTDPDAELDPLYSDSDDEKDVIPVGYIADTEDDFEHESIPDSDSEMDIDDDVGPTALMRLYDDICHAIGEPRLGSRHLPIDLTDE